MTPSSGILLHYRSLLQWKRANRANKAQMMHKKAKLHLRSDPAMAAAMDRIGPLKLQARRLSTFQSLTQAIIHQQLSGKAAATILGRFEGLFGGQTFPTADEVLLMPCERLATAGLSGAKCRYILEIARKVADGEIPTLEQCDVLTDDELIERLVSVKGIGRWTAEMMLIFNLGRPDVLPVHDLGIQRGLQTIYRKRKMPTPEIVGKLGKRWSPYRTAASWYLWRVADLVAKREW
jgi:DNA-3-methyladenine glycosylase II